MKLIVAGANGYVGEEVIRQSLDNPAITSVVALTRSSTLKLSGDTSKLHHIVVEDFENYPQSAVDEFSTADGCIWTIAVTPFKARQGGHDEATLRHICHDFTLAGFRAMIAARGEVSSQRPFRFLYVSAQGVERDPSKALGFTGPIPEQYIRMRGEVENDILALALKHQGAVEACVAKPGHITKSGKEVPQVVKENGVPVVDLGNMVSTILDQVYNGFEKEPLLNDDLAKIGRNRRA